MRLRLALPTLLAAVALVAAGCRGGEGPVRTLMSLSSSAEKTRQVGTYRTEVSVSMAAPGLDEPFEIVATGAVDTAARRQAMTMDLSGLLSTFGGALGGGAPSGSDLRVEMVVDGLRTYVRMPLLDGRLPSGTGWVSMDLAALARSSGTDLSSFLGQAYADPSRYLDFLTAAGELEELGRDEVRGVGTRHVRATVDLPAYLAGLEPSLRRQLQPLVDRFERTAGAIRPVVDAWVDDDGLVRRLALDPGLGVAASGVSARTTIDLYDFGADVAIDVPPADQVVDAASLGLGG